MPFIIKKNDKNKSARIFGSKTTYKKHRDDEDNKGFPESDTGSGSDSDGETSASSVSVQQQHERRITNKNGKKIT